MYVDDIESVDFKGLGCFNVTRHQFTVNAIITRDSGVLGNSKACFCKSLLL